MSSTFSQSGSEISGSRSVRRGTRRLTVNVPLLIGTVVVLAVAAPAMYFWHEYRADATAAVFLDHAKDLESEGDHEGAVSYYQKFLMTKPDDAAAIDAMLGLIDAYSQGERSANRLGRLNQLLQRGLGLAPERHELRVTLANNLLDLGHYLEASDAAAEVLEARVPEHNLEARKVAAIANFFLAETDDSRSRTEAIGEMLAVAEELPSDVRLVRTATIALRQHPEASPAGQDAAERADELFDRLVDEVPENVEARIARCRYRLHFRLPDAEVDLNKALELEPDNIEALLLSAGSGLGEAGSTLEKRRETLHRVIELAPAAPEGYLTLAAILRTEGKVSEAIDLLTRARKVTKDNIEIGLALADAYLQAEQLDEAKETIAEVERESVLAFPRLSVAVRDSLTIELRWIKARYALAQGDIESAITQLDSIVADAITPGQRPSPQWMNATRALARIHTQAGRTDLASKYWDSLSEAVPEDQDVVLEAVNSHLASGNPQAAIRQIEDSSRITAPGPVLMVRLVQAHLAVQLARNVADRNWTEFDNALEAAKQAEEPARELVLAEAQSMLARDNQPAALATIRAAEESFADDAIFWQMATIAYLQMEEQEDVTRALAKHKVACQSVVEEGRLAALVHVRQQDFAAAEKLLSDLGNSANEHEKQELLLLRAEVLRASGDLAAAFKLMEKAIEADPTNVKLLTSGIEMALVLGKLETAHQWEKLLAQKTDNGFEARLARARRLLASWESLDARQRQELVQLVNKLRADRPGWYPVVTLSASIAQLSGDSQRALEEFQRAVELGNRQPAVLQQVVLLLYEAGRFDEVERYMALVAGDAATTPFFDMVAIEVAARQQGIEHAIRMAEASVDRYPQDVERRLYLASLLLGNNKAKEAVEVLQKAAKEFPEDNRVWIALFNSYVRSDQVDFARKALGRLETSSLIAVEQRHFVAGQGYEIIGDVTKALEQYKLAIAAQPSAVEVRVRYANLVARQNPQEARAELEGALRLAPTNTTVQRQLAALLATTGVEADWQRANEILSGTTGSSTGDAATNDRLRAILLSQQGRTRSERIANCRLARDIITPLLERSQAAENDQNRRVMAGIYQREASLSGDNKLLLKARDEFRQVVEQGPPVASELGGYIEFLLQSVQALKQSESEGGEGATDTETQVADFLSEADDRLEELRRMRSKDDEQLEALIAAMAARIQLARDDKSGAEATIQEFVERHQDVEGLEPRQRAQRFLILGQLHGVIEAHAEAEQWYRRLMEQSPDAYLLVIESLIAQGKRSEAAQLGLEMAGSTPSPAVAKVLARIMTVTGDEVTLDPEVEKTLSTAVASHQQDIELLQAEAVMRASRGDYAPAIATMRKILEIDPKHALTLNNLATLLAERPNQRAEALDLIARAIDVAGRNPMFLDTQGTIHLKLGDAKSAIASLEEATAGRATDARYYLHLAAAYKLGGRDEDARQMLSEARAFGLENFVLTGDDRDMLTSLEASLESQGSTQE